MMKNTFIPNWYIDKKNKTKMKKIKICLMVVLIIDIILLGFILSIVSKTNNKDGEIINQTKSTIIREVKHDRMIIEKYNALINFFKENNMNYKEIIITDDNLKIGMEIKIEVKSYEEYIHAISCIENKYSIKKLTPNIKDKGKFNFKVILEV